MQKTFGLTMSYIFLMYPPCIFLACTCKFHEDEHLCLTLFTELKLVSSSCDEVFAFYTCPPDPLDSTYLVCH